MMQKLSAALFLSLWLASAALAQQVTNPSPNAGIYGAYNAGAQTCVTGTGCWVQTDLNGNLKVAIASGGGSGGTASTFGAAFPATGTAVGFTDGTNMVAGRVRNPGSGAVIGDAAVVVVDPNAIAAINSPVPLNKNGTPTGQTGVTPGTAQTGTIVGANVDLTSIAGTATPVGSGVQATALRTTLATDSPGIITLGPAAIASSVPIIPSSQYPGNNTAAAAPITGNATGSTGAVVGTLAAAASKTTFICGFNVSAIGGVATVGPVTVAGLIGSSQVYQVPVNATAGQVLLTQNFNPCIPASAVNTAITITTTADGTATAVDVNSWGYQL